MNADPPSAHVDHLVVLAATLDEGIAWCEATLGITPGAGGEHPLMGTHNRLVNVSSAAFPHSYLEIIAINNGADPAPRMRAARWFDMDFAALRQQVATSGPRLIHFVARVPDVAASVRALAASGIDRGTVINASRATAHGLLRWRISVRDDGQRLFDGALPTLIEWQRARHPTATMPASGVSLLGLSVRHPCAGRLEAAYRAIGLHTVPIEPGAARLHARLDTPRGTVDISSG